MPELPEVEVTRRGLAPRAVGRTVSTVWTGRLPLRENVSAARLRRHLTEDAIVALDRRAKYLLFRFGRGATLVLHLGMSGKLSLVPGDGPRHKHDHLELGFADGLALRFNDARRFGAVLLWTAREASAREAAFSAGQGLEPLGPDFTAPRLAELARGRSAPLKVFLMNGRLIAGIGNIYASEILFASGLHPECPAGAVKPGEWERLVRETRRILAAAIEAGGSTIADFLGADGHPGYFQLRLKVYGKGGEACPQCGKPLARTVLGGRTTCFCPRCQPPRP